MLKLAHVFFGLVLTMFGLYTIIRMLWVFDIVHKSTIVTQ